MVMLTKEELLEIRKIKNNTNEPSNELVKSQLIVNKIKVKNKEFSQIKVTIPKKFIDITKIDKETHHAEFILNKKENKISMEIVKNE